MTIRVAINGYGRIGRNILRAHYEGGKKHDLQIVALNAGTALYAAGVVGSIGDGLVKARVAIESGAAKAKMQQFIEVTQSLGAA